MDEADAIQQISGIKETDSILVVIRAFSPQDLDTFTPYLNRLGPASSRELNLGGNCRLFAT